MQYILIVLFALAVFLGMTILINWLNKKDTPGSVVYSYGIFAATALRVLIAKTILVPCMITGNYIAGSLILKYKIGVQE